VYPKNDLRRVTLFLTPVTSMKFMDRHVGSPGEPPHDDTYSEECGISGKAFALLRQCH
jgi:hypothetical protein